MQTQVRMPWIERIKERKKLPAAFVPATFGTENSDNSPNGTEQLNASYLIINNPLIDSIVKANIHVIYAKMTSKKHLFIHLIDNKSFLVSLFGWFLDFFTHLSAIIK